MATPKLKISRLMAEALLRLAEKPQEEAKNRDEDKKREENAVNDATMQAYIAALTAIQEGKAQPEEKVDSEAFMTLHRTTQQTWLTEYATLNQDKEHKPSAKDRRAVRQEIEKDPSFEPGDDDQIEFTRDGKIAKISSKSKLTAAERAEKVCQMKDADKGFSFQAGRPAGMIRGKFADAMKNGKCPTYDLGAQSRAFTREILTNESHKPMLKTYAFTNRFNQVDTIVNTGRVLGITVKEGDDNEAFIAENDAQLEALRQTDAYQQANQVGRVDSEILVTTANLRRCMGDKFYELTLDQRIGLISRAMPENKRSDVQSLLQQIAGKETNTNPSRKNVTIQKENTKDNEIESSTKVLQNPTNEATHQQKRDHSAHTKLSGKILLAENDVRWACEAKQLGPDLLKKDVRQLLRLYNQAGKTTKWFGTRETSLLTKSGKARQQACKEFLNDSKENAASTLLKAMNMTPANRLLIARDSVEAMKYDSKEEQDNSIEMQPRPEIKY